jgi:hypothetical protein
MSIRSEINREIEALKELEKKAFGPRHGKTDYYHYLRGVLELYRKWKEEKNRKTRKEQLAKFYTDRVKLRKSTNAIRAIIDASSEQDAMVKSRWTRALQYVERNAAEADKAGFGKFIEGNGGIAGCARSIAKRRTRTAKAA